MVYSRAYQDLNAPSLKLLSYLLLQLRWARAGRKSKNYIVSNKDEIKMLYSTFSRDPFNMNPNTITRSMDSLLAHGFLKVIQQGGRVKGHESVYSYSEQWEDWNKGDVIFKRRPYIPRGFTTK
jgi:hypothetical protein